MSILSLQAGSQHYSCYESVSVRGLQNSDDYSCISHRQQQAQPCNSRETHTPHLKKIGNGAVVTVNT